jgi:hypothetical protein|tara:strand:- start:1193 stop:1396 length:204 start_codon:yes stop_codon:yes gene_type:complete
MKDHLSVFEMHRIQYINKLMNRIHDRTNSLYENLMDVELYAVRKDLKELKSIIEDVEESLEDTSRGI